eukprot:TRINITY_DN35046_c0_g1_i1.p1 TRINITY_DN35046_c0_g1~~TRINITY_DN35046_c0_g1_i1.p1  ORF type:complete len:219 (+),score=28.70 TRINITY_DN35046_c0_g1_i1:52-708(+)
MKINPDSTPEQLSSLLISMTKDSGNSECMDCSANAPRWAVVNWGIFVCIRCSGIHRNLGTHISKVKSLNLDKWGPDEVRWMDKMGNERAREYLEAKPKKGVCRPAENTDDQVVIEVIKGKYARMESCGSKKPPTFKSWLKRESKKRDGRTSEKKSRKKEKKAVVEDSESTGSESDLDRQGTNCSSMTSPTSPQGVFGDVTGDPNTVGTRKEQLLALFS